MFVTGVLGLLVMGLVLSSWQIIAVIRMYKDLEPNTTITEAIWSALLAAPPTYA